jgi:hypothetical protein
MMPNAKRAEGSCNWNSSFNPFETPVSRRSRFVWSTYAAI